MEISAVVMAAGKSTRMKSKHSKVVFQVSGKPIIQWVADALFESGCQDQVYIVGEQQAEIRSVLGENVAYVLQEEQRGTGHAVMQAAPFLEGRDGLTIVLPGDCPMVSANTIKKALDAFESAASNCAAILITAEADDPTGYGRIIRGKDGNGTTTDWTDYYSVTNNAGAYGNTVYVGLASSGSGAPVAQVPFYNWNFSKVRLRPQGMRITIR